LALKCFTGFPWQVTLRRCSTPIVASAHCARPEPLVIAAQGWAGTDPQARRAHSWRWPRGEPGRAAVNDLSVAVGARPPACTGSCSGAGYDRLGRVSVVWARVAEGWRWRCFSSCRERAAARGRGCGRAERRGLDARPGAATRLGARLGVARGSLPASLRSRLAVLRTRGRAGRLLCRLPWLYNWAPSGPRITSCCAPPRAGCRLPPLHSSDRRQPGGLLPAHAANVAFTQAPLVVGCCVRRAPRMGRGRLAHAGLQVLPVLFLGAMVTGWRLLQARVGARQKATGAGKR